MEFGQMTLARGRGLRMIPGPSVMPDRVLNAMHRAAPNIYEGELIATVETVRADLRRVARTTGEVAIYIGNGHAAWEAAVANLLAPGDLALVLATGRFALGWGETARKAGVETEVLDFGFRSAVDPDRLEARLRKDREGRIRAVLVVQTDTASSVRNDVPAIRAAIDAAGHPALLAVDCIASLGCEPFEMDAWGVDVMVTASQKGLMTPPGLAFTFHGEKAEAARVPARSATWDWEPRIRPQQFYQLFAGTAPTHHIFGLREALTMLLDEEGLEAAWERHAVHAGALWAAVEAWARGGAVELNIAGRGDRSRAVTTIRTAQGAAAALRRWCEAEAGLTLGVGLGGPGADERAIFRIGHMGHVDPPMLLGALATVEAGMKAVGIAHGGGGLSAAATAIAEARPVARGSAAAAVG
jgi:alanine-glyoxylate transaminase / serine-glyoxylate transaminase / serine-pyruvate transaminase